MLWLTKTFPLVDPLFSHVLYILYNLWLCEQQYKQTTSKILLSFFLNFASNLLCFLIALHRSSARPHFASLFFIVLYFSTPPPPRLQRHHLYLYKKYRGGSAIRPLKGSYFAERFTASLTLREKDVGITQVYEWFLRLALLYIERWIKDWQDLPLHQTRILTSEGKRSKQWRGIEALHCLYPCSFFLSAGSESSLRPSHYWRQSFPE